MESFEMIPKSDLEKNLDKGKESGIIKDPEIQIERTEEKDFYSLLRHELRTMKDGGVDSHFAQIDPDKLSNKALDMYAEYKKKRESFEKDLAEFSKNTATGSDDYIFAGMVLNWYMNYISEKRHKEREIRKKLAA